MIKKFAFSNSQLVLLHTISSNWRSSQKQIRPRFPWSKNTGGKNPSLSVYLKEAKKGEQTDLGGKGKSTPAQQKFLR